MAIKGKNISDTGRECIQLANLLKVAVRLYFNSKQILILPILTLGKLSQKVQHKRSFFIILIFELCSRSLENPAGLSFTL